MDYTEIILTQSFKEDIKGYGYNARTGVYENMLSDGVIDPTKVTRIALENAASIAAMLLTTECVLADIKEDKPAMPAMPGGGMEGMY
jgi:chaperonin GroEL